MSKQWKSPATSHLKGREGTWGVSSGKISEKGVYVVEAVKASSGVAAEKEFPHPNEDPAVCPLASRQQRSVASSKL